MRKRALPKLSKLRTAPRAELLASWTATLGKPPQFRASRELQRVGLATAAPWTKTGLRPCGRRPFGLRGELESKRKFQLSLRWRCS